MTLFEKLYAENYTKLFRVAKKMMGSQDGVQDIVQDVFIELYGRLEKGNTLICPQSWLYRVTCNKCIDHLRRQKRFRRMDKADEQFIESGTENKEDLKEAMCLALDTLSPKQKMIAILYSEGLTYKEMADVIGLRCTSVGKMLSRTLLKIEKEIKDNGYEMY